MKVQVGDIYGSYEVLDKPPVKTGTKHYRWHCKCKLCGSENLVYQENLLYGRSKSCGKCRGSKLSNNNRWSGYQGISGTYWGNLISHAKMRDIPIDITKEDAWDVFQQQDGKCAYTGIELVHLVPYKHKIKGATKNENLASLDRIDSSKGYTKSNIQWLHVHINKMKLDHTEDEFFRLIKLITEHKNL
jgi:hypothetical protein